MSWWTDLLKFLFPPKPTPPALPPAPTPPLVVVEPPPAGRKRLYSVTINGYPGAQLQGCDNDGANLTEYLLPKGFEVHRLRETDATGPAMEAFWREGVRATGPGDLLVIHDSGHGSNGPSGLPTDPGQCMVSVDMRPFYASRLGKILDEELVEGGQVRILLDCCHSETGSRAVGPTSYRQAKSIPWELLDTSQDPLPTLREHRAFNLVALARSPENGIIEFAACQANDVTWDAKIGGETQGCATRAWIDAATELDAEHPEGYTVAEFHTRVLTKLPSSEFPNVPQVQADFSQRGRLMWENR